MAPLSSNLTRTRAGYLLFGDAAFLPGLNGVIGTIPETMPIELYF